LPASSCALPAISRPLVFVCAGSDSGIPRHRWEARNGRAFYDFVQRLPQRAVHKGTNHKSNQLIEIVRGKGNCQVYLSVLRAINALRRPSISRYDNLAAGLSACQP